jgi:hypothetical protein
VTKKFQLPSDEKGGGGIVSDGNRKNSIVILMATLVIEFFQLPQKASLWHLFEKSIFEGFPITNDMSPFLGK